MSELEIQAVFSKYSMFCKRVSSILKYSTINCDFTSIGIKEDPRMGNTMGFTTKVEKFIRESVSHKLTIPLVKPSNKVWKYLTQSK